MPATAPLRAMKFLLVIQWTSLLLKDYDDMVEVEGLLIDGLSELHEVDGHDVGANEVNIFIHTDSPVNAFEEVKHILSSTAYWAGARLAYRNISESEYVILWPKDLRTFKIT